MANVKKSKEVNFADVSKKSVKTKKKTQTNKNTGKKTVNKKDQEAPTTNEYKFKYMHKKSQPISIYRKIAFTFVGLTIMLAALVFYFSVVGVKIIIIPNKERTVSNFIATVIDKSTNQNIKGLSLGGVVAKASVDAEQTFQSTGKDVTDSNVAGRVTIYNNRTTTQRLVKTTRLQSPDGRIYRIQQAVEVPSRGKVDNVLVYADKADKSMEIGPTKFTIPGLSQSAQELVYAESSSKFSYEEIGDPVISESDLTQAKATLKNMLLDKLANISKDQKYKAYDNVIYDVNDNAIIYTTDAQAGDKQAEFKMSAKAEAAVVAFNTKDVVALAKLKIEESIPSDKELLSFDENNFTFSVDRYDLNTLVADLKVEAVAQMILKSNTDVISPEHLAGLTREQLDDYLSSLREVAGYEVKFTPNWLSKVPSLADHIKVEVAR